MGIDTGSALVVGLPAPDVCEDYDEFYDTYDGELDTFSPYYDGDFDDRLVGVKIVGTDWTYQEVPANLLELIGEASVKFVGLTGKQPKVYVTANVW